MFFNTLELEIDEINGSMRDIEKISNKIPTKDNKHTKNNRDTNSLGIKLLINLIIFKFFYLIQALFLSNHFVMRFVYNQEEIFLILKYLKS